MASNLGLYGGVGHQARSADAGRAPSTAPRHGHRSAESGSMPLREALGGVLLADADVPILRDPEEMPWGERIATVADPEGNPIALCQEA